MSILMDNFHLDVTARGKEALELTLRLTLAYRGSVTHWCNHPAKGLVLFWSKPDILNYTVNSYEETSLPSKAHPGDIIRYKGKYYIWTPIEDETGGGDPSSYGWSETYSEFSQITKIAEVHPFLTKLKKAEDLASFIITWLEEAAYGPQPDHDGDNTKGFRIYNDRWGQVENCGPYSFVTITPEWAELGK